MKTFVTLLAVLCGVGLALSGGVDNPVLDTTHTNYLAGDTEIVVTGDARSGSNVLSIGSTITRDTELAAYLPLAGGTMIGELSMGGSDITSISYLRSITGDYIWSDIMGGGWQARSASQTGTIGIVVGGLIDGATYLPLTGGTVTGPVVLQTNLTVDTSTLVVDPINNRVGIGTNAPASDLHLAGSGTIARGITFADGDSGFYESTDDIVSVWISGGVYWRFSSTQLGASSYGGCLTYAEATATVPTICPYISDTDTGIGRAGANSLSIIAGGASCLVATNGTVKLIPGDTFPSHEAGKFYYHSTSNKLFCSDGSAWNALW